MTSDTVRAVSDLRGATALAGRGVAATTSVVRDTHAAIAGRVFRLTGRPALPARVLHDGISKGVYAAVGGGVRAASYGAGQLAGAVVSQGHRESSYIALADRPRGNLVVGALNGAWGDTLVRWRNPLALTMTVRDRGRDVATDQESLQNAFASASGDVVVFLHGLCETDRSWWLSSLEHYGDRHSSHGSRLAAATGATPVYLRYNSGLHISDNGEHLSRLLAELTENWPVPITRLTLVGHSMGGLVVRSACAHGAVECLPWMERLGRVVYLGAPHLGAPLEVAASATGRALRRLPETRPLGVALASRSVGIKDMRHGDLLAADWAEIEDLDAWRAEPAECAALLESAEHYYIGVTLTRRQDHMVARVFGDALVTFPSASGSGKQRRLSFEVDRGRHLGGLNHFDLLNHPRVWALLSDWLTSPASTADDGVSGPDGT